MNAYLYIALRYVCKFPMTLRWPIWRFGRVVFINAWAFLTWGSVSILVTNRLLACPLVPFNRSSSFTPMAPLMWTCSFARVMRLLIGSNTTTNFYGSAGILHLLIDQEQLWPPWYLPQVNPPGKTQSLWLLLGHHTEDQQLWLEKGNRKFHCNQQYIIQLTCFLQHQYHNISRCVRQWRSAKQVKCSGGAHHPMGLASVLSGAFAVECPACPHPGRNLPVAWKQAPDDRKY